MRRVDGQRRVGKELEGSAREPVVRGAPRCTAPTAECGHPGARGPGVGLDSRCAAAAPRSCSPPSLRAAPPFPDIAPRRVRRRAGRRRPGDVAAVGGRAAAFASGGSATQSRPAETKL